MLALRPFVEALQSLAGTLRSHTLAYVRTHLSVVRRLLATIGNSIPLIGDTISFISGSLALQNRLLAPPDSLLALSDLNNAGIEFTEHAGTVLGDHNSP